ncbi:MAG TPA: MoaD/ThiS family protein [Caulobacteraceae bacterium]
MIRVLIPSQLQSYTAGATQVEARGGTIEAVLEDLDRLYPGIKFRVVDEQDRVRRHMKLFVGLERAQDVRAPIADGQELLIFGALSGG